MKKILIISLAFLFLCFFYSLIESNSIRIQRHDVYHPQIPKNFHGFKIIFFSDIHYDHFFSTKKLGFILQIIHLENPDLILMGGDYVDKSRKAVAPLFNALSKLRARKGIFGVLGNHDHWTDYHGIKKHFKKSGFTLLENKSKEFQIKSSKIYLAGTGSFMEGKSRPEIALKKLHQKDFVVLLSHNPDVLTQLKSNKADLILCGHTHGGQITFFGLFAPYLPNKTGRIYRSGYYRLTKNNSLLVSNGLGTTFIPLRFFAPPEIHVINLFSLHSTSHLR